MLIYAREMTAEVSEIARRIEGTGRKRVMGFRDDEMCFVGYDDILRFEAMNQKVFAQTKEGALRIKQRLYELEEALVGTPFVRISNSEIVNFDKVASLDLSMTGILILKFKNGDKSYVSRRYVKKIKDYLGL